MHTITGWVSRNLHAITMRSVQHGGPFDGYENNAATWSWRWNNTVGQPVDSWIIRLHE